MKIGILGGGCFWKTWKLPFEQIDVNTPYGKPADLLCKGIIADHEVYTLQRHGRLYQYSPENIPYQANVYAFQTQNVDFVIDATSSGSLRTIDNDGDLILFDQIIDYTRKRPDSLFRPVIDKYINIDFSQPISQILINFAHQTFLENQIQHHCKGTVLTEDGPRFSTLSESRLYKMLGADFVNQTSCPSIYFFRELNIPVLGMTMITNSINFDNGGQISTTEISESIVTYGNRLSNAIRILIEKLPNNLKLEKYKNKPYDTSKFELREFPKN